MFLISKSTKNYWKVDDTTQNKLYFCQIERKNMRVVIQRVSYAKVAVLGEVVGQISNGLLILLGVEDKDTEDDIKWLTQKIVNLRIFADAAGVMNVSVKNVAGEVLVVSQFTLMASTKKGNRPSYVRASKPEFANMMYERFTNQLAIDLGKSIQKGIFGADMQVSLCNDGPVTILIDTHQKE